LNGLGAVLVGALVDGSVDGVDGSAELSVTSGRLPPEQATTASASAQQSAKRTRGGRRMRQDLRTHDPRRAWRGRTGRQRLRFARLTGWGERR
jgi:hypothetical protein